MSGEGPPLLAGPIHGVRVWNLRWESGSASLAAIVQGTVWPGAGEPLRARCVPIGGPEGAHAAPVGGCVCGIYALHPRRRAAEELALGAGADEPLASVAGIVEAWGRVELAEDGFRAEYARPKALALIGTDPASDHEAVIRRLAERYRADFLRFPTAAALIEHCRENGLGVDARVVDELVFDPSVRPQSGGEDALTAAPSWTPPAPSRWARVREVAFNAFLFLLGILWYGFWAAMALAFAIGIIAAINEEEPSAFTGRDLRVVEQALVRIDDELSYVAVVRNESRDEAALGVFPRGAVLDSRGAELARLGGRSHTDVRASLAPGEIGIVVDRRRARGVDPAGVERYDVELVARRVAMPGDAPAEPRLSRVDLDRSSCRLVATVRAPEAVPAARVAILARDRAGAISAAGRIPIGPLPAGRSRQVLDRGVAGECPRFVHEVELLPHSTRARFAP